MWKRLQESSPYYLLFIKENIISVSITDYVKIWTIQLNDEEFRSCLKESNLSLEIDTNELRTNGLKMLSHPESLKSVDVTFMEDKVKIYFTRSFGYPLKIKMLLKQGSQELKVTQPLIRTVHDLRSSENELRNLLKCKDREIEEYKIEAGEVCLRYLKTKTFNDEVHMDKHTLYDKHFGSVNISASLLEKSVEIPPENVIKQEQVRIKKEPSSQNTIDTQTTLLKDIEVKQECIKIETPTLSLPTVKKRKIKLNI